MNMMKKTMAFLLSVFMLFSVSFSLSATAATEEKKSGKPAVLLESNDASPGSTLLVTVKLSGCEGLTSADLIFQYDPNVLTFLGGALRGAAAGDRNITAALSDGNSAKGNGYVSLSLFHMDEFSDAAGNDALCELAFRAGQGRTTIKAKANSFCIEEKDVKPSLGSVRYSSGLASFFKNNGSSIFVFAVLLAVIIVLLILLYVIRRTKKKLKAEGNHSVLPEENDAESNEPETVLIDVPIEDEGKEANEEKETETETDEENEMNKETPEETESEENTEEEKKNEEENV